MSLFCKVKFYRKLLDIFFIWCIFICIFNKLWIFFNIIKCPLYIIASNVVYLFTLNNILLFPINKEAFRNIQSITQNIETLHMHNLVTQLTEKESIMSFIPRNRSATATYMRSLARKSSDWLLKSGKRSRSNKWKKKKMKISRNNYSYLICLINVRHVY